MLFYRLRVQDFQSIADSGELELGPINLLVGRNNTGKSALLRAVYLFQEGAPQSKANIRLGANEAQVSLNFQNLPPSIILDPGEAMINDVDYLAGGLLELRDSRFGPSEISLKPDGDGRKTQILKWSAREPSNLIYPSLARRQQQYYQQQPTLENASTIYPQDSNLVSRVAGLATAQIPEAELFRNLCIDVLGFTVDVLLGNQQNQNQQLGIQVSRYTSIALESMGSGVSAVLGLLVSLCDAKNRLFLIEEPENDLHPQALKALLDAIVIASESNQFLITTHNSVVLTKLGAVPGTVVLQTASNNLRLPSSKYTVVSSPEDRLNALRQLGYELADFYLGVGWLIFEESSAERIIREWFIPWFAPALRSLRTVAAKGTSRVSALAQNLGEMLVFAHLEQMYKYRAWVLVDGDESGKQVVEKLRTMFTTWPEDNFTCWEEAEFESYYPSRFHSRVIDIRKTTGEQRQEMKKALLQDVLDWIDADPETARSEFEISATDVIAHLKRIEEHIITD